MKRIAFVIATLSGDGAERTVSNIVTNLPDDYIADIILNDANDIVYAYKGNIISLGLKPKKNKVNILYQLRAFAKRIMILNKLKREKGYLAVLSFSDSANVANILSRSQYCKTIISVRNNLTQSGRLWAYKYIVNPLARCLYNRAEKVVALSYGVAHDLTEKFGINSDIVKMIYNGIDIDNVLKKKQEKISDSEKLWGNATYTLVTMGRLETQKGQWHLIRSLLVLEEKGIDFQLLVLGEGALRGYLENLAENLGIKEKVVFCGFCNNPFKIIKEADLCVFPSLYEGFGNTLIEAMCCGVPCIAADYDSGAREILAPNTDISCKNTDKIEYAQYGVLIPVCDGKKYGAKDALTKEEQLMGKAMFEMLMNQEKRFHYKEKQKERVVQFDMYKIVQEWLEIIEN